MLIWEEALILKECAKTLPPEPLIINIGAGAGTGVVAVLEERPDAFVFSIDKEEAKLERTSIQVCGLDPCRCVRLLGRSWDVGKHFPFRVDLVFVDGDHGNIPVKKDIEAWLPKVYPGGIIAFHDYNHDKVPGLTDVVDTYMKGFEVIGKHRYLIAYRIPA
jgi:predicted O-methyltransferase YrrM